MINQIVLLSLLIAIGDCVIVQTAISHRNQMTLLEDHMIHPWVYDTDDFEATSEKMDQAFVDWSNVQVRQLLLTNNNEYVVNITLQINTTSDKLTPFFQESIQLGYSDTSAMTITLLPGQTYAVKLQYGCVQSSSTKQHHVTIIIREQTFRHNEAVRDELFEYNLRLIKYCNDPLRVASDHFLLILQVLCAASIPSLILLICDRNSQGQQITEYSSFTSLFVIPGLFLALTHLFSMSGILVQMGNIFFVYCLAGIIRNYILKSVSFSSIISSYAVSILIAYIMLKTKINVSPLCLLVCLTYSLKLIEIATYNQFFLYVVASQVQEVIWISSYQGVDKHSLYRQTSTQEIQSLIPSSILSVSEAKTFWFEKQPEVLLYQIVFLNLVINFMLKKGLFDHSHVKRLIILFFSLILGLYVWLDQHLQKQNPLFLGIVGGSVLFGGVIQNLLVKDKYELSLIQKKSDEISLVKVADV